MIIIYNVKEELSVSSFYTINNNPRNNYKNRLGGLNNVIVGILISFIKGLL